MPTETRISLTSPEQARAYLTSRDYTVSEKALTYLVPCHRCCGRGGFNCWSHIHSGVCFSCRGARGKTVEIVKFAKRVRATELRNARKAAKFEAGRAAREAARTAAAEEKAATLAHRGTVGTREVFEALSLVHVHEMEGYMPGTRSYLFIFRDADGNGLTWKASGWTIDASVGDTVTLRATVKEHATYTRQGVTEPTTRLTRCKLAA